MTLITADAFVTADSLCVLADGSILIVTADSLFTADEDMITADGAYVCIYGSQGPSRSQKEQKRKSYRDKSIDWLKPFNDKIEDKKTEIKEVKKQIKIIKSTKKKVSPINFTYFDNELLELTKVLDALLLQLEQLKEIKYEVKQARKQKVLIEIEPTDDFEDILVILKFVLKRI